MRIQNSRKTISAILALAAIFCPLTTNTAKANGFSTNTTQLPDASKINRTPLKFQIVDESPQVTDTRHPKETTVYQINVPPLPQNTTHVVQIGTPSASAGNQAGNPSSIPVLQNPLLYAGPRSNINPHQSTANQLPNGTSTRRLAGTMTGKPNEKSTPVAAQPALGAKPLANVRPTSVASYPTSPSSSLSENTSTNTHVMGSLLHPKREK